MTNDRPLTLIVGIEEESLLPVMAALEQQGYAPLRVDGLESALKVPSSTSVSATLVYLSPTEIDAFEALHTLRQLYPDLPHLLLAHPEAAGAALASGRAGPEGLVIALPNDEGQWLVPLERALTTRDRPRRRDRLHGSIP